MKTQAETDFQPETRMEVLANGDPVVVAFHAELPGVLSHGETVAEATSNWREVLELYREHCRAMGLPVPSRSGPHK